MNADGLAQAERTRARAVELRLYAGTLQARARELISQTDAVSGEFVATIRSGHVRPPPDDRLSVRFPPLRPFVALARHELGRWLEGQGIDPVASVELTLACSEACANAVEHPLATAQKAFELEATREDDVVEIVVRDYGGWAVANEPGAGAVRGRGLQMIRSLMDDVHVEQSEGGTRIVMRRRLKSA